MKRVYFVRHGSTAGNESDFYQFADTPLSQKGREQAEFLGKRFLQIPFDTLIASSMQRARETARIIGDITNHDVVAEPLFAEVRRPSEVWGKSRSAPEVMQAMQATYKNFFEGGEGHYSDEENYHDTKARAEEALAFLINQPEETLTVVTHKIFLGMLFAVMVADKDLTPLLYTHVYKFLHSSNTSITWCEYDNKVHPGGWQLFTWNDHAHLG